MADLSQNPDVESSFDAGCQSCSGALPTHRRRFRRVRWLRVGSSGQFEASNCQVAFEFFQPELKCSYVKIRNQPAVFLQKSRRTFKDIEGHDTPMVLEAGRSSFFSLS